MKLPKHSMRWFGATTFLVGGLAWMAHVTLSSTSGCGSLSPWGSGGASTVIAHAPTLSVQTISAELTRRHSPLGPADAAFLFQESQQYSIDDAFALAVFASETQDGREAVPGTNNIGNITANQGVAWAGHIFAVYPSWQVGIDAWFVLIERLYTKGGHASDLLTFALYYVDGVTPQQASDQQKQDLLAGYVHNLTSIIASLQAQETHPPSGSPGTGGANTTLAEFLPAHLSPAWAGPGVLETASQIPLAVCTGGNGGTPLSPMVTVGVALAAHLEADQNGSFDRWGSGTPNGVRSQAGITWCTDYVASVYEQASHQVFPAYSNAADWWDGSVGHHSGFVQVPAGPGSYPQAGDIIVLRDGAAGHVALALGVQLPHDSTPGFVIVGQGHATHAIERWTLWPDGTLKPPWQYWTQVPGYIRIPALAGAVTGRVRPLIQADLNAGYDSRAQHDAFWNADCAAAVLTEVLRAWGVSNLTLGHVIDALASHQPDPYLTAGGGLLSQAAFDWFARQYHFQAQVQQGRSLSYAAILSLVGQGIPVIIGVRDTAGTYYPAFSVGHFLVVTGGDATHLQVVDSSLYRIETLTSVQVNALWTGETIVITPA